MAGDTWMWWMLVPTLLQPVLGGSPSLAVFSVANISQGGYKDEEIVSADIICSVAVTQWSSDVWPPFHLPRPLLSKLKGIFVIGQSLSLCSRWGNGSQLGENSSLLWTQVWMVLLETRHKLAKCLGKVTKGMRMKQSDKGKCESCLTLGTSEENHDLLGTF
jgi:hypothetical protein